MVVHIGQMSGGFLTKAPETPKHEEPKESFESVLVNAGKAAESQKALEKKGDCAEDAPSETGKVDDATLEQSAEVAATTSSIVVPQIMVQTSVDTIDNVSANVSDLAPTEVVAEVNTELTTSAENFVQFAEVETVVSDFAIQNDVTAEVAGGMQSAMQTLEQISSAETEMPEIVDISKEAKYGSATLVANDRSLLTNAENTVEGLDELQVIPDEATVSGELNKLVGEEETNQDSSSFELGAKSFDVSEEVAVAVADADTSISVAKTSEIRVETREVYVSVKEQVVSQITRNLENVSLFRNEISFVLNPENLGKVSVRMVVENSVLTVELSASNKETQSILAANIESIKEALRNLSTDNQVQNIMQETHPDYLQQHAEQNGGNNHHAQDERAAEQSVEDTQFTENFLTMLDMFGSEDI